MRGKVDPSAAPTLVVLRRKAGPPLRVKAQALTEHKLRRSGESDLILRLWSRSSDRYAVSLTSGDDGCCDEAELCDSLEAALAFAEALARPTEETPHTDPASRFSAEKRRHAVAVLVGEALGDWVHSFQRVG